MRHLTIASACALGGFILPASVAAQDWSAYAGFTVTSEYVTQGFESSDGFAVQPYIELGYGGFYATVWATNLDPAFGTSAEVDYYLGYRGEVGSFFYDIGYGYYTFEGNVVSDYGEVLATLGYSFTDNFYASLYYGYADEIKQDDIALTLGYVTNDGRWTFEGTYGDIDSNFGGATEFDWNYWSVGASYALTDTIGLNVTYHDADDDGQLLGVTDGVLTASMSFDFSLR